MSKDQVDAQEVALKYFELQNKFRMDPELDDLTPLTDITTNDAQLFAVESIDYYRGKNSAQTAPTLVVVTSVGSPQEGPDQSEIIQIAGCMDSREVDVVDTDTGESILPKERSPHSIVDIELSRDNDKWLVSNVDAEPAEAC